MSILNLKYNTQQRNRTPYNITRATPERLQLAPRVTRLAPRAMRLASRATRLARGPSSLSDSSAKESYTSCTPLTFIISLNLLEGFDHIIFVFVFYKSIRI